MHREGDDGHVVASDIPSFIEYTKDVTYLHDGDVVILGNSLSIFNLLENKEVVRPVDTVEWSIEQAMKGNFDHFMLKEISEQVETIQRAIEQDKSIILEIAQKIKDPRRTSSRVLVQTAAHGSWTTRPSVRPITDGRRWGLSPN